MMATEAGGTHPTGMLLYFCFQWKKVLKFLPAVLIVVHL